MKTLPSLTRSALAAILFPLTGFGQVNSGSDGHDGALNPTSNLVIDMADHPDGIYHYTSVNIPAGVQVTFTSNAANTPVAWLIQDECTISGSVIVSGLSSGMGIGNAEGGAGGIGGHRGGNAGAILTAGLGPGGGAPANIKAGNSENYSIGDSASYATAGFHFGLNGPEPAPLYGSKFLVPLIGGSGGGGGGGIGGGGGGGAILIAAKNITINGTVQANGGDGLSSGGFGNVSGAGSGGAIRLVCGVLNGNGSIYARGGRAFVITGWGSYLDGYGGDGRVRIDALSDLFNGSLGGSATRGFQPIIIPPVNQAVSLAIQSIGGIVVTTTPTGKLTTPDVIVPAHQQNPISIVVGCTNIPLNTDILIDVKPANGATVHAVGLNTSGTQASSTATVQVNMPRGGGTIQARAVSGLKLVAANNPRTDRPSSLAETGWTADGERFAQVEVTAVLGGAAQIAYLTESGKRFSFPNR